MKFQNLLEYMKNKEIKHIFLLNILATGSHTRYINLQGSLHKNRKLVYDYSFMINCRKKY